MRVCGWSYSRRCIDCRLDHWPVLRAPWAVCRRRARYSLDSQHDERCHHPALSSLAAVAASDRCSCRRLCAKYLRSHTHATHSKINASKGAYSSLFENTYLRAKASHNVTFCTTQANTPRLNPSQRGQCSFYLLRRDEKLSWPEQLVTYGLSVRRKSSIQVLTELSVEQLHWLGTTPWLLNLATKVKQSLFLRWVRCKFMIH